MNVNRIRRRTPTHLLVARRHELGRLGNGSVRWKRTMRSTMCHMDVWRVLIKKLLIQGMAAADGKVLS